MKIGLLNAIELQMSKEAVFDEEGNLILTFAGIEVEKLETIFSEKSNISTLKQLDDAGAEVSSFVNYTELIEVKSKPGVRTVVLGKGENAEQKRVTNLEATSVNTLSYIDKSVGELTLLISMLMV